MRVTQSCRDRRIADARKQTALLNGKLPRFCTAEVTRHGKVVVYFRRVGLTGRIRIRSEPLSGAFYGEYSSLLVGNVPVPATIRSTTTPATWRWLCEGYFKSIQFKDLEPVGQRIRRRQLEASWEEPITPGSTLKFGNCPLKNFDAKSARILRDRKLKWLLNSDGTRARSNTQAANSLLKYMRGVFEWAKEEHPNLIERNWAKDVGYFRSSSRGFHTWTLCEIAQYEQHHPIGTKARLTLALALYAESAAATLQGWVATSSVMAS